MALRIPHSTYVSQLKHIVPQLRPQIHKGQCGRVGIVGGSLEYIGAPYYAAISSLYTGGDLAYVFCAKGAGVPLKTMSPEMIVYPLLKDSRDGEEMAQPHSRQAAIKEIITQMTPTLDRLHALVIGPGLGRDEAVLATAKELIVTAKMLSLPLIIDGDGLFLVAREPQLITGYPDAILTPNVIEYKRLIASVLGMTPEGVTDHCGVAKQLASKLGNVTIVKKGDTDLITDGHHLIECAVEGGLRRCGGQGDVLAGAMGTFRAWMETDISTYSSLPPVDGVTLSKNLLAAYGACTLTRSASKRAFDLHFRATTTPAIIEHIGGCFRDIFEKT